MCICNPSYLSLNSNNFFGEGVKKPTFNQCCGSGPFFSDPDPADPKKTGSGSFLDMFEMFSKINNYFYTKSKHLMTLKIKDKKLF